MLFLPLFSIFLSERTPQILSKIELVQIQSDLEPTSFSVINLVWQSTPLTALDTCLQSFSVFFLRMKEHTIRSFYLWLQPGVSASSLNFGFLLQCFDLKAAAVHARGFLLRQLGGLLLNGNTFSYQKKHNMFIYKSVFQRL